MGEVQGEVGVFGDCVGGVAGDVEADANRSSMACGGSSAGR